MSFKRVGIFLPIIICFLLIIFSPLAVSATSLPTINSSGNTYYVSTDGSNSNKGTKAKPFKTISYGIKKLKAGDTLYIRKGTYKEKLNIKKKGKSNKYITISSYKKEKVVISGKGKSSPTLMSIKNSSYVYVNGLTFTDATGADSCGIYVGNASHHIVLSKNTIKDIDCGSSGTSSQDCANGILIYGSSSKSIHDVWVYKNEIYDLNTGWAEALSVTANCRKINVLSNTVKNITNIGIDFSGNYGYCKTASKDFPTDCVIANNTVTKCVSPYATSYGIYVDGGQDITVKNNTVSKCSGGIEIGAEQKPKKDAYSTGSITVKNNTVKYNKECGISIGGYQKNLGWVKNVTVTGNKFTNNGKNDSMITLSKCKNITFRGNTFKNTSGECSLIYSEFASKYTKNITWKNNKFIAPQKKNNIYIMYLGKEYGSFAKWLKVVGSSAATYKKY
ncbi:MAG: right-handed parallel beta-helix repeat-containing protein [Lachnospiraceae bacterium]|nr:right-handed parallel beta-helix repeat-containing protein [Lachnospiraceae bacterium]